MARRSTFRDSFLRGCDPAQKTKGPQTRWRAMVDNAAVFLDPVTYIPSDLEVTPIKPKGRPARGRRLTVRH
jgi:hypothetical protein